VRGPLAASSLAALGLALAAGCGEDPAIVRTTLPPVLDDVFDLALFAEPPLESRPYVRFWWPGAAVDEAELAAEIRLLRERGFGGVEIQPFTFGLGSEDEAAHPIRTYGSEAMASALRATMDAAAEVGLAVDLTLGSGWPSGGPFVKDAPSRQLLSSFVDVAGPAAYAGPIAPPEQPGYATGLDSWQVGEFDADARLVAVVAAHVVDADAKPPVLDGFVDVTAHVSAGTLTWEAPAGSYRIFSIYENRVHQLVLGSALPEDTQRAIVVDHLDRSGVDELVARLGDPLLDSLDGRVPGAVFVDSFELLAELPWTPAFLSRFNEAKGYDPTPYLPLLFRKGGEPESNRTLSLPRAAYASVGPEGRAREDYEDVREAAFVSGFLEPLTEWAASRGVAARVQAHGAWADYLDAYAAVDVPEAEGLFQGGHFDFLKLAPSAAHVAGRRVVSSESFVAIVLDPRQLSLDDVHLLGGRALSAGITRLVWHGFAYSFQRASGDLWYPFDGHPKYSTRLDAEHPIWPDLRAVNDELARLGYALTRGEHVADVAWLHAKAEHRQYVGANFVGFPPEEGESTTSLALTRAGFVYDRVSRKGLESAVAADGGFSVGAARYKALLVTDFSVATPEAMASLEALASAGVPVLWMGALPERAPGLVDHEARDRAVVESAARLAPSVCSVATDADLGAALASAGLVPALVPPLGEALAFKVERRSLPGVELVLLFNESNEDRSQRLQPHLDATSVEVLDPATGALVTRAFHAGWSALEVSIPAKRTRLLRFGRAP
jgi:hypothetical protein